MRRAIIALLALAGCSSQVERTGSYQYTVTALPDQVYAKAKEICAKLGRPVSSEGIPAADIVVGVQYLHVRVECFLPFEVVPVNRNSYKIWVPTYEFPPLDGCENCVPPHPPTVQTRVKELATDYCATMHRTMKQTGGDFGLGTGLNTIFSCVPRQN